MRAARRILACSRTKSATRGTTPRARLSLQALETRTVPAVFTVTNTFDSGLNSLRAAITNANNFAGPDTISFFPGVTGTLTLTTGELNITDAVTIVGPGKANFIISGNNANRVFNTSGAPAGAVVNISGLTLTGGKSTPGGGAVFAGDEIVSLTDCAVTGNTSVGDGGGIYL